MKSIKLTDSQGYALTEKRIIEIDHELNGAYYGQDLGPVYDQDGNHTEQMQALEAAGHIGRTDERDNALVYRPGLPSTIEKLRNAYWRMDDALDGMGYAATPNEGEDPWHHEVRIKTARDAAYRAHGLLWDILKDIDPAMTENIRPGDDPSPANNND